MPRVDLASADHELLRLLEGLLQPALRGRRKRSREEAHLVALRILRDLAERIELDDPRQIRRGAYDNVDLEPELRLDQTLALPSCLLGLRLARKDDVAALEVGPHIVEAGVLQRLP